MDIENLIENIKAKLLNYSDVQYVKIEDKTYLHLKHLSHDKNKFHLKLLIHSKKLKDMRKIEATKKIYKILDQEIKNYIHSIQILFE